jgi:hypothetical protein
MSEECRWLRDGHGEGALIRDLVRIVNAQVSHRLESVIVQPKNGLLSLPKRATGQAFSRKSVIKFSNDVQHHLSGSHDIEWKWLLTPEGTYWETHHNVPPCRRARVPGLCGRRPDPRDRRAKLIVLTRKGRACVEVVAPLSRTSRTRSPGNSASGDTISYGECSRSCSTPSRTTVRRVARCPIGLGAIAAARTRGACCCRSGSCRRSGLR